MNRGTRMLAAVALTLVATPQCAPPAFAVAPRRWTTPCCPHLRPRHHLRRPGGGKPARCRSRAEPSDRNAATALPCKAFGS